MLHSQPSDDPRAITIRYRQEPQDVRHGWWVVAGRRLVWIIVGCWIFVGLAVAPGLLAAVRRASSAAEVAGAIVANLMPVLIVSVVFSLMWWWVRRRAVRSVVLREVEWVLGEQEVLIRSEVTDATVQWKAFVKYRETGKMFLLYPQKNMAQLLPKRVMTAEQMEAVRDLLARHVKRG